MNYETASDFELEVELHTLLTGKKPIDRPPNEQQRVYISDIDGFHKEHVFVPSYCSDWNAAMPLMIENKISLRWLDGVEAWGADQVFDNQVGVYSTFTKDRYGNEIEALRAIVICLIKVLEAEE